MLVEVLDEVIGDVQCLISVEDIVAYLSEDELVATILVVLLELGTDLLHHILEHELLLHPELLSELSTECLALLLHADDLLLLGLLRFSRDEGIDTHTTLEVGSSLLYSSPLAL